ncbi:hypothetical protein [Evansella tamaricis]|uniref:Uncharacterized protein n=1 Tax=Evansella tamaricis TaxID=2069301 RepID=A0ABS6JDC5_9BACI|nr:hypothetical protein [Evansella tamaricis]MBU9711672.1 hypothetical protein [Evansella tamaricis]
MRLIFMVSVIFLLTGCFNEKVTYEDLQEEFYKEFEQAFLHYNAREEVIHRYSLDKNNNQEVFEYIREDLLSEHVESMNALLDEMVEMRGIMPREDGIKYTILSITLTILNSETDGYGIPILREDFVNSFSLDLVMSVGQDRLSREELEKFTNEYLEGLDAFLS